ncbi:MAG: Tfp pilus assembly protein PilX [Zhongshania aliphaticivorans]|jgi:Tfp pilus assembly protein PilX|uniref:Tfp pilus assembly protein PilX n=1 Tax=Zhongshania antarctica TaxID=641702 RepID=A0A840R6L0_9GAMM|nr:pilus assembly protein [Zhongshania antarctica]MBB5188030.1 Tfp pilus assembly protein PilX [Zhongshania antarctica]
MHKSARSQAGVVLIVVLIMLGVFSIIVVSMLSGSNINFKIAGNQQFRFEARTAAKAALESYISNSANFAIPVPEINATYSFDLNGNGNDDITANVLPPKCLRSLPIKLLALKTSNPKDDQCWKSGQKPETGIFTDEVLSGNSDCSEITWDVQAEVKDAVTSAEITMHQGLYLRANVGTNCI